MFLSFWECYKTQSNPMQYVNVDGLPSGELTFCYGKIHHVLMGESTISMAMFNSFLLVHQRVIHE